MAKQKLSNGFNVSSSISDPRFSSITTDPRFRLPSKKQTRTKIDKRFSRMLTDDDFFKSATVDRYGRKLDASSKKKALERLYLPADRDNEDRGDSEPDFEIDQELSDNVKIPKDINSLQDKYDPARGGGFSSSDNEESYEDVKYDPARAGGFSSSEDEESDKDDGGVKLQNEFDFPDLQAAQMTVEMGEVSSRLAVVNLDWDNLKSVDLFAVFSSFLPPGGKILKISIYPSEFGKERMDREDIEGPPREIFVKNEQENSISDDDSSDEDEKIARSLQKPDDGVEYNDSALRQYQLERLRYFYAVVICSSPSVAQEIYEATDGREYLSSANFLDLRFIPEDVEFEDNPRDECTELPAGYRPTEFITTALQHSKVKLTWDTDPSDVTRKEVIKRVFSSAPSDIIENDLQAYLCSESESDEEVLQATEDVNKNSKKELARQKIRAALGLGESESKPKLKKDVGPVGDMKITFTPGLSSSNSTGGVFENKPIPEETTAERYVRLERERKARRKERAKAKRENGNSVSEQLENREIDVKESKINEETGFDGPFFAEGEDSTIKKPNLSLQRKAERLAKRESKIAQIQKDKAEKAQLELLLDEEGVQNGSGPVDHFDINEIVRAEKNSGKKNKKKRGNGKKGDLQESFEMDVHDARFSKVFESHEYAIDPSNPRFKETQAMKKLLEEGRKKRCIVEETEEGVSNRKKIKDSPGGSELRGLIEKVKKSKC